MLNIGLATIIVNFGRLSEMENSKSQIDQSRVPKHVAIIMDGNGRWAKEHGKPRVFGHKSGVDSVREVSEAAAEIGVQYLTLYAFSTENWSRPAFEVNALMTLLVDSIRREMKSLNENNIKLIAIGDISSLPSKSIAALKEGMELTANNTGLVLNVALNYSSRSEIVRAVKAIGEDCKKGIVSPSEIDENVIQSYLYTRDIPDPELMIRTSGEIRISNFLLWQLAYTELCFFDIYWPDFKKNHFFQAIVEYQSRDRRFGNIK